jgi:hypothetical protein
VATKASQSASFIKASRAELRSAPNIDTNPLYEAKAFSFQGDVTIASLPKMRAMTVSGLCIFLEIGVHTWHDYRKREDFSAVTTRVDEIIRTRSSKGRLRTF